jgi:hypothetical protein
MTNRQRISEKLLADLADVWQEHGVSVLLSCKPLWTSCVQTTR